MKYLKTFENLEGNEYIRESVTDSLLVVLLILFIKSNGLTPEKMASNLKSWVVDFCSFVSAYGYPIDREVLDLKLQGLLDIAFDKIRNASGAN